MIRVRLGYLLLDNQAKLKELSEATGIAMNNLSILKNNKAMAIRFSTLEVIRKALKFQPGDLLEHVEDPANDDPRQAIGQ
jgi:putative transcriptional regulator